MTVTSKKRLAYLKFRDELALRMPLTPVKYLPLDLWPWFLGEIFQIRVPRTRISNSSPSPLGAANVKIILHLLNQVTSIEGAICECGVFRGKTIIPMALFLNKQKSNKIIYGFDSFEGLDETVKIDLKLGGMNFFSKQVHGFNETSIENVSRKIKKWKLESRITLVKGYFKETLPQHGDKMFSFVHLDCNLYQSYKECMEFFYPRINKGAVILLDEYNDPPWPGCNKAVDEFLADKAETLQKIEMDNYQKWYLRKQ